MPRGLIYSCVSAFPIIVVHRLKNVLKRFIVFILPMAFHIFFKHIGCFIVLTILSVNRPIYIYIVHRFMTNLA